jgi:urease accessory protein
MIEITHLHRNDNDTVDDWLDLPYELRCRSRFRTTTRGGADIGIFLERGLILDVGDVLVADDGRRFGISAANETVVTAYADDWNVFARACYHLGNRHVPMQIGERWLRIQPDHVLQELIENFGLRVENEQQPFRPESGAYSNGQITKIIPHSHGPSSHSSSSHSHGLSPLHDHSHDHSHDHHDHHHG